MVDQIERIARVSPDQQEMTDYLHSAGLPHHVIRAISTLAHEYVAVTGQSLAMCARALVAAADVCWVDDD